MQSMKPMKKKAIGGLLQKKKAMKPTRSLTPSPKTIGNPRSTQPVINPQPNAQAPQFSPQPVMNEAVNPFVPVGGEQPQLLNPGGSEPVDVGLMQPENARQSAMERLLLMRKMRFNQSPSDKFKPIGNPRQPIQQQNNPEDLYMRRMMQQMQNQQQGRFQF